MHGGAGGIGTFAIQLAAALGARVFTTPARRRSWRCAPSWAPRSTIDYREQDFVEVVKEATDGHGADVILDNMGASYLARNVDALATEGRLVVIGMQGGTKGELDLGALLRKRGAVIATSAAPAARGGEGRDLRGRRRARLAAGRRRHGATGRRTRPCRWRRWPRRTR